ncbi:MAG: primosomal protein N' [Defluviitaleaceae bacterium]|nr:primosomal protein N' [Defluviitaleaceae bacterium]
MKTAMTTKPIFVKVAVLAGGIKEFNKTFDYAVPQEMADMVRLGQRVLVPFGKSRNCEAFVIDVTDYTDVPDGKIKAVAEILDEGAPVFSSVMIDLARWMSQKYSTHLAVCLKSIMPSGIGLKNDYVLEIAADASGSGLKGRQKQLWDYVLHCETVSQRELAEVFGGTVQTAVKALCDKGLLVSRHIYEAKNFVLRTNVAYLNDDAADFEEIAAKVAGKGGKQAQVLALLQNNRSMPVADIQHLLNVSPSPVKSLEQKGLVRTQQVETRREVLPSVNEQVALRVLTDEQAAAMSAIERALGLPSAERKPILIHGVTGSGKTELYIKTIQKVLDKGQQAIMLVPEISLTPQTIAAFSARFGNKVTATHSRLSLGERYDQWKKARDGQVSVIIGPRSALFTPFDNLGVIIIDEEHESTYKSNNSPKYDTLAAAEELSRLTGAMLILGSATPHLCTYHRAKNGEFELVCLKNRIGNLKVRMEIADMRAELADGNKSMFSVALYHGLGQVLAQGKQAILFMNRRGHSTFVSCRTCGFVMDCSGCNVNYTYHMYSGKLICHYCSETVRNPKNCPQCGSIYIKYFGVGTQKIEEYLNAEFPAARVLRMDMDTTSRKGSHLSIIQDFADKKADILVGTQMIAKGLNFPDVDLVGIVAADTAINNGDFRAAETAYQLITQVAGRAARGDVAGRVIIQTYNPEHYSIKYAMDDDFEAFYNHELTIRKQMNYPPFASIFQIMFAGENEKKIIQSMHMLADIMKAANRKGLCELKGPAPAVISKIKMNYRWKLLVKCHDEDILRQFVYYCLEKLEKIDKLDGIKVNLTPNPAYIL